MKKYFLILGLVMCLFITGCGNDNNKNVLNDLIKTINNLKSYNVSGKLEVINNDDTFNYDVNVDYMEDDYYRVSLKNLANNHEQIILKNEDGVYVVTPSLNKSFKFQSNWPYNNSQVYLLKSIISDINKDSNANISEVDGEYVITSSVNFPNNASLVKQKVTVDSNKMIKKVEIQNSDGISMMIFNVTNTNYKPIYDESYFEISSIINNSETNEETNETSTIDDIIYPLYIPTGTVLQNEEKVSKTDGERVILTFSGDKPFTLVEETVKKEDEFTIVPTYGEPYLLIDTLGALSDNSINWVSNGIEYYIVSDVMKTDELIEVAKSVNVISVLK